jgi:rhomboid protease GluP
MKPIFSSLKQAGATCLLILVFFVVFLYGQFLSESSLLNLVYLGAKQNGLIAEGQFYRLVTSGFLHAHVWHFLFNSLALLSLGLRLEPFVGFFGMLILFLLGNIYGNVLSFLFSQNLSVGASGGIFAVLGALVIFEKPIRTISKDEKTLVWGVLLLNLVFGIFMPMIDLASHVGGLFVGFGLGYFLILKKFSQFQHLGIIERNLKLPSQKWTMSWLLLLLLTMIPVSLKIKKTSSFSRVFGVSLDQASIIVQKNKKKHSLMFYQNLFEQDDRQDKLNRLFFDAHRAHQDQFYFVAEKLYRALLVLEEALSFSSQRFPLLIWLSDWMSQAEYELVPYPALDVEMPKEELIQGLDYWSNFFQKIDFFLGVFWIEGARWLLTKKQDSLHRAGAYLLLASFEFKSKKDSPIYFSSTQRDYLQELDPVDEMKKLFDFL